jgi:hypothetical protein
MPGSAKQAIFIKYAKIEDGTDLNEFQTSSAAHTTV